MRTTLIAVLALSAFSACNEPPGAPGVAIEPAEPRTDDGLQAVITEEAVDPNKNDTVTYTYEWQVDGTPVPDITGADVPADRTKRGEVWAVTVTPADDKESGPGETATVTVGNTKPVATASIAPESPLSSDDLLLTVETEDADGDTVNTTVSWTRDGDNAAISSQRIPSDRTRPGQVWEATVIPQDAREAGEPVVTSVMIENQAPTVEEVYIRPPTAYEKSVLEAVIDASDPDRDELTYTTEWFVNGVSLGVGTDTTLDGESFSRGDTVEAQGVANDGIADSPALKSEGVTILNTPPTLLSAAITPTEAYEDTVLSCAPTGWADDDGDIEDYRFEWLIDGVLIATTATVDGSVFAKGDDVACAVIPFDGTDEGRPVTARPVEILNTAPSLTDIEISPEDPVSGTDISAAVTGASDLDEDPVTIEIEWFVDGRKVASGPSLPAGSYIKDEEIYALATPDDGEDEGVPVKSNTVTSVNAPPTIESFSLSPIPLFSRDTAAISIVTDDWDGDTLTLSYEWTINGTAYGDTSTSAIPSSDTTKGDIVEVTVTVNDGEEDGDTATDTETVKLLLDAPGLTIDPEQPKSSDDLFCEVTTPTVDADGDPVSYVFTWYADGTEYKGTTSKTDWDDDTVPSSATSDGEEWECEAYAVSKNGASESATTDVIVGNLVSGFSGKLGPVFKGWFQCEGYLDKAGSEDIPGTYNTKGEWGDDCTDTSYTNVKLVCGSSKSKYRYIDVKKNVFSTKLTAYPERSLITEAKDQSGTSWSFNDNAIYATSNDMHAGRSWWGGGLGCSESNANITINNVSSCTWEANNCFGQNLTGDRYLWVYVK